MLNNLRESQQNNYQNQLENQLSNQVQQVIQQPVKFRVISFLLYSLMLIIVITLLISILVANKNRQTQQILLLGILLIPQLIVLLGCIFYILLQFSEAQQRMNNIPEEMQLNRQMYQSSVLFFLFYTNQSKFTVIRLTYLYIVLAMCILIQKLDLTQKDENKVGVNNDDNNESGENGQYQIKSKFKGQLLIPLFIFCLLLVIIFLMYEVVKIILTIYLKCRNQSIPQYQYNDININVLKVIRWSKAFCVIFLINHIGKMMILCTIFITPNSSSYILIGSNLFYHFFMATIINTLFNDITAIKRPPLNDSSLFINHQILIDSIIKNMHTRKVFQILLLTSFIFTIIGTCIFRMEMDPSNDIINRDIFIFYDCAIFQLIILGLALLKYMIIPYFNRRDIIVKQQNQAQHMEDQQLQTLENQQIRLSTEQAQLEMNIFGPQNNEIRINQSNILNRSKLPRISNILHNNDLNEPESDKADCIICLQPMTKNKRNPLIQLSCHNTHIFHQKCIRNWLAQNKKCPLCNTPIL